MRSLPTSFCQDVERLQQNIIDFTETHKNVQFPEYDKFNFRVALTQLEYSMTILQQITQEKESIQIDEDMR